MIIVAIIIQHNTTTTTIYYIYVTYIYQVVVWSAQYTERWVFHSGDFLDLDTPGYPENVTLGTGLSVV